MTKEEAIDILKNRDEGMSLHKVELAIEYAIEALSSPEICKDSLQVPETCKENTDSFTSDLEEAARHSEILTYPMPEDGDIEKVMKVQEARIFHEIGFIAGAGWQREKMKKEEVEGAIWEAINRYELEKKLNHEEGR